MINYHTRNKMKKTNKIIIGVILIAVMVLGIGYAAIQNITLNIQGTAKADPSQSNFKVMFSGTPVVSDAERVVAAITDDVNATINVTGLTAKGETVTATYTVQNASVDLSADLSVATTNSNTEYFTLKADLAKTSLVAGEATTLTVTVTLAKTPVSEAVNSTIGIQLTATPVEPGQEGTSGNVNGSSQTPDGSTTLSGPYLPTGFSKVAGTSLENGYTIQDSKGNQYVWVEVPRTTEVYPTAGLEITEFTESEYSAIQNDLHSYSVEYRDTDMHANSHDDHWTSEEATGLTEIEYNTLKNKMMKSIYQNEGFYVGKYETGTETARTKSSDVLTTPIIKQNVYPYNFVTRKQAQTLTNRMESGENTTSLMFGVQWDLMYKYLETKKTTETSEKFGNMGISFGTGSEWVLEACSVTRYEWISRRGSGSNSGVCSYIDESTESIGFRVTLY